MLIVVNVDVHCIAFTGPAYLWYAVDVCFPRPTLVPPLAPAAILRVGRFEIDVHEPTLSVAYTLSRVRSHSTPYIRSVHVSCLFSRANTSLTTWTLNRRHFVLSLLPCVGFPAQYLTTKLPDCVQSSSCSLVGLSSSSQYVCIAPRFCRPALLLVGTFQVFGT